VEEYAFGPLRTMGRKLQSTPTAIDKRNGSLPRPSPEYCQTHNAQTTNAIHRVVVEFTVLQFSRAGGLLSQGTKSSHAKWCLFRVKDRHPFYCFLRVVTLIIYLRTVSYLV
jgi:hypothetical protein